ncbi:choline/carnitine/betaine transport [Promicromonospora umidemergens]|uniref:BCCT family transporter n=1 Tax=Promicromonospora umidemergens TaxID=629679 RepID=A0ABP8XYW8_9MICO|nr:BCCT family transporter [Promicromonospora umidemergens]MCP2286332.1 choline/carnitine/betaine transport [Promicromonospora umidemergens]
MSNSESTKTLLGRVQRAAHRVERAALGTKGHRTGTDKIVFGVAGVIAVAFVVWGFTSSESLGRVSTSALDGIIKNFGWLFVIAATVFTVFVLVVALGKFGKIPLGQDDEKPQYKTSSWISMMFATGMGIGLMFYGVGEPLYFYMAPPPGTVEGSTPEAAATAMGTTLFHWTLYPWAMYAIVGLGMAYGTYRLGRNQLFSSMFTSLFGSKAVNGGGGRVINIMAILATLFGSACSLGLGALQIGGGLQHSGFLGNIGTVTLVGIIAILTILFVISAVSGIERGIQLLANTNMWLALALAVIVFIGGPTLFILNVLPASLGAFVGDLPEMASRTAASGDQSLSDWMGTWTIFYWAWWVSWTPFVGPFIARISRGRTVRQFVVGVLLVPSIVSTLWFAIFGGGAIGLQERAERAEDTGAALAAIGEGGADIDFDLILFQTLGALPVPGWVGLILMGLAVVLVAIFFITGADSASIIMGGLSQNGAEHPTKKAVVFWGVSTGAVAAAMLLAGGDDPAAALNGLKNITIVSALPFVVVILVLCVALWKDLARDPLVLKRELAVQVLAETVSTGVEKHEGEPFELSTAASATEEDSPASATEEDSPSTPSGGVPVVRRPDKS